MLENLPVDVLIKILADPSLNIKDICHIDRVCKRLHSVSNDEKVWHAKIQAKTGHQSSSYFFPAHVHPKQQLRKLSDIFKDDSITKKLKTYIKESMADNVKDALSHLKEALITELRNFIKLDVAVKKSITQSSKNQTAKEEDKGLELSTAQKNDLLFFEHVKSKSINAQSYIIAWTAIDNIYDKKSTTSCVTSLQQLTEVAKLNPKLSVRIKNCLKLLFANTAFVELLPEYKKNVLEKIIDRAIQSLGGHRHKVMTYAKAKATKYLEHKLEALQEKIKDPKEAAKQASSLYRYPKMKYQSPILVFNKKKLFLSQYHSTSMLQHDVVMNAKLKGIEIAGKLKTSRTHIEVYEKHEQQTVQAYRKKKLDKRCDNLNPLDTKLNLLKLIDPKVFLKTMMKIYQEIQPNDKQETGNQISSPSNSC